jgi:hypothetical protein
MPVHCRCGCPRTAYPDRSNSNLPFDLSPRSSD